MPVQSRRVFRLAFTMALALAWSYGSGMPLPFLAPMFVLILTAKPSAPMGAKGLLALILLVLLTLGIGLVLAPMLDQYRLSGLLLIAVGLYVSNHLSINLGKGAVGMLLTVGLTMIPAAGSFSTALALAVIQALVFGIAMAVISSWLVYPFFPEDPPSGPPPPAAPRPDVTVNRWISLRAALVVLPPFLLALTNPSMYMALIMKSVTLGQQASLVTARSAGRELLGSTFAAGCFAILLWVLLDLAPTLWFYAGWMLLFFIYFAAKLYTVFASRFPPSFWQNVITTMLILLGSAVEDSANGQDVYAAFAVRLGLFIAVTFYAWLAIAFLEYLRERRRRRVMPEGEFERC
ncbi:hypothetical protein GCM10011348_04590 [Marinobacterium nitratireducens]|uniref:DUF2955 domain-containing protein n=2 Tax=Marinobacterium nitratireducens TaxID=518897 RepID=A0A918DQ57_9GAMM|nr:hypothetical protein GCM10011348_04590 [Marinobacterium nitratireducens]